MNILRDHREEERQRSQVESELQAHCLHCTEVGISTLAEGTEHVVRTTEEARTHVGTTGEHVQDIMSQFEKWQSESAHMTQSHLQETNCVLGDTISQMGHTLMHQIKE